MSKRMRNGDAEWMRKMNSSNMAEKPEIHDAWQLGNSGAELDPMVNLNPC